MTESERTSLQKLSHVIQRLHDGLLDYPGSFLLYKFYEETGELPLLMTSKERQASLLQLLNDLVYMEDGQFPLMEALNQSSNQKYNRLYSYIE